MNVKIFEAIGKFIDNNYLIKYTIEGYFGFAYFTSCLAYRRELFLVCRMGFDLVYGIEIYVCDREETHI